MCFNNLYFNIVSITSPFSDRSCINIFSQSMVCLFIFLTMPLRSKNINFDAVNFFRFSCVLRNLCLTQDHKNIPLLQNCSFNIQAYFQFIFIADTRFEGDLQILRVFVFFSANLFFVCMWISPVAGLFVQKNVLFPGWNNTWHLCQISIAHICEGLFVDSLLLR